MTDRNMTIREMCDTFEVTPRTLRFYESKELLFPIREGQKRWFTQRDRARLKLILRGKRYGFSLEDIRQILDLYDGPDGAVEQLRRCNLLGSTRLEEMKTQRAELDAAIAELDQHLDWTEGEIAAKTRLSAAE